MTDVRHEHVLHRGTPMLWGDTYERAAKSGANGNLKLCGHGFFFDFCENFLLYIYYTTNSMDRTAENWKKKTAVNVGIEPAFA
jgi:hypothetical protein